MSNANIRRYERELKKSVRGFRLRKQLPLVRRSI